MPTIRRAVSATRSRMKESLGAAVAGAPGGTLGEVAKPSRTGGASGGATSAAWAGTGTALSIGCVGRWGLTEQAPNISGSDIRPARTTAYRWTIVAHFPEAGITLPKWAELGMNAFRAPVAPQGRQ